MSALAGVVVDAEVVEERQVLLSAEDARALTGRLRGALEVAHGLLLQAYHGQAHTALGYRTWTAYCAAELGDLAATRLPVPQRRQLVRHLVDAGMSRRAVAAGLGLADQTVRAALAPVPALRAVDVVQAPVVAEPVVPAPPALLALPAVREGGRGTDRVVALAAAAGREGVTWADVAAALSWHHGQASGALSSLHAQDRLTRLLERRDGSSVYVHPDVAGGRPSVRPRR